MPSPAELSGPSSLSKFEAILARSVPAAAAVPPITLNQPAGATAPEGSSTVAALPAPVVATVTPPAAPAAPDNSTLPEGAAIEIDDNHPMAAPFKEIAHKHEFAPEVVNDLLQLHANHVASEAKAFDEHVAASKATLGANANARIEAVQTALLGRLGEPGKALIGTLISAEIVTAFEALLRSTAAPGPSAVNGAQKPRTDMSKMSTGEKFATILAPPTVR